jgi:hypothetical protein
MTQQPQRWKTRFQEIISVCQDELKKTTEIGKRMLSASKTTSALHETCEELGQLVVKSINDGSLQWENSRVHELVTKIKNLEKELEAIEAEVNRIKFSAGPEDISKDDNTLN